jgi:hypothetical protein
MGRAHMSRCFACGVEGKVAAPRNAVMVLIARPRQAAAITLEAVESR